ncbi:MAG: EFR1 family ferrodoxin [Lachnospiraceae bacterium]|nr:EFR1 family ferrodoxin [Lachnospiraceae bacterium]
MIGIYFSGTGNSRYALETFMQEYDNLAELVSIEDKDIAYKIEANREIIFCYPVQYSNIPLILGDFIVENKALWKGKKIFVIATMALFSGDGAGILARLLHKYGADIIGGLHLKMPDSIADVKALKRPLDKNIKLVEQAKTKISLAVGNIKEGNPPQEGIGLLYRMAGLFGQRLYFINKTKKYTDKLKINTKECIGCGKCAGLCPMENITMSNGLAKAQDKCTMCYRCINSCPKQAITLLGKKVIDQGTIEKYL